MKVVDFFRRTERLCMRSLFTSNIDRAIYMLTKVYRANLSTYVWLIKTQLDNHLIQGSIGVIATKQIFTYLDIHSNSTHFKLLTASNLHEKFIL